MTTQPPAPIVKTYPRRGPLLQVRLERATPFTCFRCGQVKKAKLQTLYDDDWSRLLCNGCYGRLLSIHEIAAGSAPDEEKADQLAALLLELASADEARAALRRRSYAREPIASLSAEAVRFLSTAEFVAESLRDQTTLEWSPAIIGLCKAAEHEVVGRLLVPLRRRCGTADLGADLDDRDLKRLAGWCAGLQPTAPELGTVRHVLVTAANSKNRARRSPLLLALLQEVRDLPRGQWLLAHDGLAADLLRLTGSFRNPAAHTEALGVGDYVACRELVAGDNGLLWKLVDATA